MVARSARLVGAPLVRAFPGSTIEVGERAELVSAATRSTMVLNHPCQLQTYRAGARITIGEDVGMSGATICAVLEVSIGARTMLGANATVIDTGFHPLASEGRRFAPIPEPTPEDAVVIGCDVFIGTGAFVLPGTRIGDGSVVAAGAVVKGKVEPGVVVAGNPARVIRTLD
jgi:acetyltransferase-like isoleucine patch superfamily enzyme